MCGQSAKPSPGECGLAFFAPRMEVVTDIECIKASFLGINGILEQCCRWKLLGACLIS
jgi:hypothetical protein